MTATDRGSRVFGRASRVAHAVLRVVTALVFIGVTVPTAVIEDNGGHQPATAIPTEPASEPIDPPVAKRLGPPTPEVIAPPGSLCPELYAVAVEHWPGAALHWPLLDKIFWRESRCKPYVVNRYGCVGLMQVCRINHRRLGVTRWDLMDPATNIEIGYRLCQEQTARGRSCYRPWWLGRWRP